MKASHRILSRLFLCLLLPAAAASTRAADGLQAGDLVAICGDSITEQKLYSLYIADYLLMCQPAPKLQAVQFGWGGETAIQFLGRMKVDALPFKPTVATTCYGMNDGGYTASTPARLDQYRKAMTGIVTTFKEAGVRFIVVGTPGVVDTKTYKKNDPTVYNNTLKDLANIAKEVAAEQKVGFADVHSVMMEVMAKAKAKLGDDYAVAGGDGVHPGPNGHVIMAYAFLKGLGCDGNIGTISLDLKSKEAKATDGHKVLSSEGGEVTVESTRYPFCLPGAPSDPKSPQSILEFLPFHQDLNRYLLVVKNAPGKTLKVTWGTVSKEFPAEDLAKGINLAAEFPENPFSKPFADVQTVIHQQQSAETTGIKSLLHSTAQWEKFLPEDSATVQTLSEKVINRLKTLREASSAAVVPVKHTIKVEPVS